jgi:hypothetical protein
MGLTSIEYFSQLLSEAISSSKITIKCHSPVAAEKRSQTAGIPSKEPCYQIKNRLVIRPGLLYQCLPHIVISSQI